MYFISVPLPYAGITLTGSKALSQYDGFTAYAPSRCYLISTLILAYTNPVCKKKFDS